MLLFRFQILRMFSHHASGRVRCKGDFEHVDQQRTSMDTSTKTPTSSNDRQLEIIMTKVDLNASSLERLKGDPQDTMSA